MGFIVYEDELWPIVSITASGHFSIKQHVESLKQWNKWLARHETFYIIRLFLDNEATQHTSASRLLGGCKMEQVKGLKTQ